DGTSGGHHPRARREGPRVGGRTRFGATERRERAMTKRAASLVIGLWLFALATSASAECAWVLWQKSFSRDPQGPAELWVVVNAHDNHKVCGATLVDEVAKSERLSRAALRVFPSAGAEVTVGKNWVSEHKPEDSSWLTFQFFCLPDTVDPRGPKAK